MYIYSAHDTTVAPILHTLGVFNGIAPPYASMVMVELLDLGAVSGEADLRVRVLYHNDTSVPPYPMILPGCETLCTLKKFKGNATMTVNLFVISLIHFFKRDSFCYCNLHSIYLDLTSKYIPVDIIEECGVLTSESDRTLQQVTMVAAVCSTVMAVTVLIATLSTIFCSKKKEADNFDFPSARLSLK